MSTSRIKSLLGLVLFFAVGLCLTEVWSYSTPLPAFNEALAAYRGQTPLVLGGYDRLSGGKSFHRRNYVLLFSFKFVEVTQTGDEQPKVREEAGDFVLVMVIVFAVFFWVWWRRSERADEERCGKRE